MLLSTLKTNNDLYQKGTFKSIVPSGASKGDYEAVELRDGDAAKFHGQGVSKAVHNVNEVIWPALKSKGFTLPDDVAAIDKFMIDLDGSDDKGKLGSNAILAISMACWRAAAGSKVYSKCFGYPWICIT